MCLCVNNNLQKKQQQQLNTTTRTSLNFFCFYFKFFFCRHDSFDLWPSIFNTDANRSEDQKKKQNKNQCEITFDDNFAFKHVSFFTLLCYIIKDSCCEASVCVCVCVYVDKRIYPEYSEKNKAIARVYHHHHIDSMEILFCWPKKKRCSLLDIGVSIEQTLWWWWWWWHIHAYWTAQGKLQVPNLWSWINIFQICIKSEWVKENKERTKTVSIF